MLTLRRGRKESYSSLEGPAHRVGFSDVLRLAPELVLGHRAAVTSCDSGEVRLSADEISLGWSSVSGVALSPPIRRVEDLIFSEEGDEIYLFSGMPILEKVHVFINNGSFQLSEPCLGSTDWLGDRHHQEVVEGWQLHFWDQLESLGADTFLGQGSCLLVVSKNHDSIDRLASGLSEIL